MARYVAQDGRIMDTEIAVASWKEATEGDGDKEMSVRRRARGYETLYRSTKGHYYIESRGAEFKDHATIATPKEAATWLLLNNKKLPDDLAHFEDKLVE